ncbi:glycosyltransferase family 4 protein [Halobellus limi]|uniref:Glycosyltransferase n=1 Tax=Halobellus limi TaxID=699433 RepID=A0A1H5TWX1_9EURY|nr:glycosyltransferase family 4 protein [Halobellus limi]QCC47213.1 glycosyltransferase [Halobellus limi]SEF67362.1 Glycosyltransferase involved in cell wall bisynthesis [Halobellus limi]
MSDRIVIAHGGDVSRPSGGTNRVSAFASGLVDHGHDVTLVVPEPEGEFPSRLSAVDVSPVSVPNSGVVDQPLRAAAIARRANRIASRTDATVQFEHSTLGGVGQILGAHEFVLDMHDLAFESPLYGNLPAGSLVQGAIRRIEGRAVRGAAAVVVVSERMRELVSDAWDVDPESITVIPNGYFADEIEAYRTAETVPGRVAFLGTLHPKLDAEAFFETAALPEVEELIVIGDGAKHEVLEEGKHARGLDSLRIAGRLPDEEAFELVASSSVAINPQQSSGLQRASSPVKLYYYAALGVPMVVSAGPSVVEELAAEGAAVAVESGSSFADAVQEVLQDEERQRDMSERVEEIAKTMRWDRRVDRLADLYRI